MDCRLHVWQSNRPEQFYEYCRIEIQKIVCRLDFVLLKLKKIRNIDAKTFILVGLATKLLDGANIFHD